MKDARYNALGGITVHDEHHHAVNISFQAEKNTYNSILGSSDAFGKFLEFKEFDNRHIHIHFDPHHL